MKTSSRSGRMGKSKFYYKCAKTGTGHAYQTAQPVERLITEVVIARLEEPGVIARLSGPLDQELHHDLHAEAATLRSRMDEAADSFAAGRINIKTWRIRMHASGRG